MRQITHFNDERLKKIAWGDVEQFSFKGAKGDTVYGFVVKPPGVTAGKVPVANQGAGTPWPFWVFVFPWPWPARNRRLRRRWPLKRPRKIVADLKNREVDSLTAEELAGLLQAKKVLAGAVSGAPTIGPSRRISSRSPRV